MASDGPPRLLFQRVPGVPSAFYFHKSIKDDSQRESLRDKIITNGGKVQDEERGADTVLVNLKHLGHDIKDLQTAYSIHRDEDMQQIAVEPLTFVQRCLERKEFVHHSRKREAMGGYMKKERTEFTSKDDDNLCWYISRRIPNPEDGGRFSDGIWKELLAAAEVRPGLEWARRHTVQSWRERYRKRAARFDPIIAKYARENPPRPVALYGLSRKYNKNPGKALQFVEREDDVIELTEESAPEPEDGSSETSEIADKRIKASKRRRAESSDGSSSASVAKRKKVARSLPSSSPDRSHISSSPMEKGNDKEFGVGSPELDQDPWSSLGFSPAPEPFEPVLPHPQQSIHSPSATRQTDIHSTPPAPSPTLVQRASSAIRSPPSRRPVNVVAPPSPRPSTSFRNVVHSSPIFTGTESPRRSGIQSHNTSVTEPSSRSMVAPPELVRPSGNAANAPAESSITRESSHKPSSPNSQPMLKRKASRKLPSRQPPPRSSYDESERESEQEEIQWAPYKNTRSRSRSIEPASRPVPQRRGRGRNERGKEVVRNERPLEPVHESEVELGQENEIGNSHVDATVTETMREEQNVADLLILSPGEPVSRTHSGVSTGQAKESVNDGHSSEGATEDEGEGVKHTFPREKNEEETQRIRASGGTESTDDETAKFETAPTTAAESHEPGFEDEEEDDIHDISSFSESERAASHEEDSVLDISSDDEFIEQQFLSKSLSKQPGSRRRRRSSLSSDEIGLPPTSQNTPARTAQEVLDLFDSSPEVVRSQEQQQRPKFNSFRTGSPSPLQPQKRSRARQSLPVSRPPQATFTHAQARPSLPPTAGAPVKTTPVNQLIQRLTGPHRVSFSGGGGGGDDGLSSSPSSIRSLPRAPLVTDPQPIQGRPNSQARSSVRRSNPLSQPRQAPPESQAHSRGRRASAESTSSELRDTFPVGGTRASAVKRQLEQELKESPYTPPSGTRAAQIVVAERTLRPRRHM